MITQEDHIVLDRYRSTMKDCISLYYPDMKSSDLDVILDYSINKRYRQEDATLVNSYKNKSVDTTLLKLADYIMSRHPITTAFGTMFMNHETVPNPMADVVQQFLDDRKIYKDKMFEFKKGSEDYERYNLLQSLAKIKSVLIILVV